MGNRSLRIAASFRLTSSALYVLKVLAIKNGISQAAVLEMLIRDRAKKEKVEVPVEAQEE